MSKLKNVLPAAFMGAAVAPAVYKDVTSGLTAKMRNSKEDEKISKEEEIKRKQEPSGGGGETKSVPKAHKAGGKISSASKRADGCATKGKTRGRMV
jgi:hypothetical protein